MPILQQGAASKKFVRKTKGPIDLDANDGEHDEAEGINMKLEPDVRIEVECPEIGMDLFINIAQKM